MDFVFIIANFFYYLSGKKRFYLHKTNKFVFYLLFLAFPLFYSILLANSCRLISSFKYSLTLSP